MADTASSKGAASAIEGSNPSLNTGSLCPGGGTADTAPLEGVVFDNWGFKSPSGH